MVHGTRTFQGETKNLFENAKLIDEHMFGYVFETIRVL